MSWNTKGRLRALQTTGDVSAVRMITTIHDTGVDYEVRATLRSLVGSAFEEGEGDVSVWFANVTFGHTDATISGGASFRQAAREQEKAAHDLWTASQKTPIPQWPTL